MAGFRGYLGLILGWLLFSVAGGCGNRMRNGPGTATVSASPDGKQVVFSALDGDLYLLDLQSRKVQRLTKTPAVELDPSFSPDGKFVVYSVQEPGRNGASLSLRSLDGTVVKAVTSDPQVMDSEPSFSLDGNWIAFARAHRYRTRSMGGMVWDQYDIYVARRDGTGLKRLTSESYYQAGSPRFLGSDRIVYWADVPFDTRFFGKNMGGSVRTLLEVPVSGAGKPKVVFPLPKSDPRGGAWGSDPSVSPDGRQLAFISDRASPFAYDIWVMDLAANTMRPLGVTSVSSYNSQPIYCGAGGRILFLAATHSTWNGPDLESLWEVDANTGKTRRIADTDLFTDPLHWKP